MNAPPPRDAAETLRPTALLAADHEHLKALVARLGRGLDGGPAQGMDEVVHAIRVAVDRHLAREERFLFPLFEARMGLGGGPTAVLREEHGEIRRALERMEEALADGNRARLAEGAEFFREVHEDHCGREERLLFPIVERVLTPPERKRFIALLRSDGM